MGNSRPQDLRSVPKLAAQTLPQTKHAELSPDALTDLDPILNVPTHAAFESLVARHAARTTRFEEENPALRAVNLELVPMERDCLVLPIAQ